ncbi:MAG: hypothetical protein O7B35_19020 [Deltaproteobacteria bacterium]|nr:hypothetical protein [Deltaproteobacteria bacterium]
MREEYLGRITSIVQMGGEIALDLMSATRPTLKPDNSVVTEADLEVSRLARLKLRDLLARQDHLLIEEEDSTSIRYLDDGSFGSTRFVWALDPIDGTRAFANGMPTFGISIGLLRNLRPWLGAVYFPMLRELFYSDGQQSFFVQNAFQADRVSTLITPVQQEITNREIFLCNDSFSEHFEWRPAVCQIMNPCCASLSLCWPTIGRGCGAFFGAHIWDFAGAWPIVLCAGLNFRSYGSGAQLRRADAHLFCGSGRDPWKLRDYYILSSESTFSRLRKNIVKRP